MPFTGNHNAICASVAQRASMLFQAAAVAASGLV